MRHAEKGYKKCLSPTSAESKPFGRMLVSRRRDLGERFDIENVLRGLDGLQVNRGGG